MDWKKTAEKNNINNLAENVKPYISEIVSKSSIDMNLKSNNNEV